MQYYTLNSIFVLRENKKGRYILYNKIISKTYFITTKLYYMLKYFQNQSISFLDLNKECETYKVDATDFYELIAKDEFKNVLVPTKDKNKAVEYNIPNNLSPYTYVSPERVDLFITKHCNLACRHCFEGSAPSFRIRRFTNREINRVVSQLESANIKILKITGGEPFSHPDINTFLKRVSQCHFKTIILTNALLLNSTQIDLIKNNNMQLGISLDGITAETYNYIRGKGTFNMLLPILQEISYKGLIFSITCTINKINLFQTGALIDYVLDDLKAQSLLLGRLRPMGRANYNSNLVLSEEENKYVRNIYFKKKEKYKDRLVLADDSTLKAKSESNIISCSAGNSIIALDENFDVYPCIFGVGHPAYIMGNLLTQDLETIWGAEKWKIFRGGTHLDDLRDCRKCKLSKECIMKNCRLKPVFEGNTFLDAISYCEKKTQE